MSPRDRLDMTSRERRQERKAMVARSRGLARRLGPVPLWAVLTGVVAVGAVVAIAAVNTQTGADSGSGPRYDVGRPGVGVVAPDFELASATGAPFKLSGQVGKQVLLYFHEGLGCAPCWTQIGDIQADLPQFTALGIEDVVSISIDPLAAQQQRATSRGISLPVLADQDRAVSTRYNALSYSMMQGATPGHTFILVGTDGRIRWRADYGGPPDFTMYVPTSTLLAELRRVLGST